PLDPDLRDSRRGHQHQSNWVALVRDLNAGELVAKTKHKKKLPICKKAKKKKAKHKSKSSTAKKKKAKKKTCRKVKKKSKRHKK
ncbi:MAG: hypothetical protein QOJ29_226, partial [Thermoleophilaceae bacterium]|nr:hypothetical protein [Thermoleophilaceae bacterium]